MTYAPLSRDEIEIMRGRWEEHKRSVPYHLIYEEHQERVLATLEAYVLLSKAEEDRAYQDAMWEEWGRQLAYACSLEVEAQDHADTG